MEEERYHYTYYLDSDNVHLVENTNNIKICRRCGIQFIPKDDSGTNAYSFRCEKCMSTKEFLKDLVYSCNIM